jgi:hypothetical protein
MRRTIRQRFGDRDRPTRSILCSTASGSPASAWSSTDLPSDGHPGHTTAREAPCSARDGAPTMPGSLRSCDNGRQQGSPTGVLWCEPCSSARTLGKVLRSLGLPALDSTSPRAIRHGPQDLGALALATAPPARRGAGLRRAAPTPTGPCARKPPNGAVRYRHPGGWSTPRPPASAAPAGGWSAPRPSHSPRHAGWPQ